MNERETSHKSPAIKTFIPGSNTDTAAVRGHVARMSDGRTIIGCVVFMSPPPTTRLNDSFSCLRHSTEEHYVDWTGRSSVRCPLTLLRLTRYLFTYWTDFHETWHMYIFTMRVAIADQVSKLEIKGQGHSHQQSPRVKMTKDRR